MKKLYCFVDETGQDTKGKFFLVVVVTSNLDLVGPVGVKLQEVEEQSGKKKYKWGKTVETAKIEYFRLISQVKNLHDSIYFSVYHGNSEYVPLVSLTIAKAVLARGSGFNQMVRIIIDGLNDKEKERISKELKKLKIRYDKIRGMRDEKSSFLRLADAIAGLLRDSLEGQEFAQQVSKKLLGQKILREI